jgi:hypothetical protein
MTSRAASFLIMAVVAWSFFAAVGEGLFARQGFSLERLQAEINTWVMCVSAGLGSIVCLWAAIQGAGAVVREREQDTATSLLLTPLSAWAILKGKFWGGILSQRIALYVLAFAWSCGALTGAVNLMGFVLFPLLFGLFLSSYTLIGLFCSVNARSTFAATIVAATLAGLASGGAAFLLTCSCLGCLLNGGGKGPDDVMTFWMGYCAGLCPPVVFAGIAIAPADLDHFLERDHMSRFFLFMLGSMAAVLTWLGLAIGLSRKTWQQYRRMTNRYE